MRLPDWVVIKENITMPSHRIFSPPQFWLLSYFHDWFLYHLLCSDFSGNLVKKKMFCLTQPKFIWQVICMEFLSTHWTIHSSFNFLTTHLPTQKKCFEIKYMVEGLKMNQNVLWAQFIYSSEVRCAHLLMNTMKSQGFHVRKSYQVSWCLKKGKMITPEVMMLKEIPWGKSL